MPKVAMYERGLGMEWLGGKLFGNHQVLKTLGTSMNACGLHTHEREWEDIWVEENVRKMGMIAAYA